jgi:hypothetical protein
VEIHDPPAASTSKETVITVSKGHQGSNEDKRLALLLCLGEEAGRAKSDRWIAAATATNARNAAAKAQLGGSGWVAVPGA